MGAIAIPSVKDLERIKTLAVSIVSPETEVQARGYLTEVRTTAKKLEADLKLLKKPHQDAIKEIDAAAKPWRDLLAEYDAKFERAILDYARQVRLAAEEKQRKELEKYERKVDKAEAKAVAEGRPMPIVLPPPVIATPPKTVETDGAKQTIVKRKAWRLGKPLDGCDPEQLTADDIVQSGSLLPLQYFVLDTARIGKIIRAGGTVPGIEVYEDESLSIKAV